MAILRRSQEEKGEEQNVLHHRILNNRAENLFLIPLKRKKNLIESSILKGGFDSAKLVSSIQVLDPFSIGKLKDTIKPCAKMAPFVLV